MILTEQFKEAIKADEMKMKMALKIGISYSSFQRWLTSDNEKFATLPVLSIIENLTGLTADEVFEKTTETVK